MKRLEINRTIILKHIRGERSNGKVNESWPDLPFSSSQKKERKLINYANLFKINEKCYFSISWPILILFVLSDRAGWGLQNFYRELWNSLIMQIYANLFKINKKCYFVISWPILILFVLSDRAWCGLQNFYTEFWNSLIMQIYSKSAKNATSLFLGRFWFCLIYLIGLGGGFKTFTQNFEIH